ncbi:response regulator transcription factor [Caminibacter sp.]
MKILILEDDYILADSLKELLTEENFEVDIAQTPEEAYEKTFHNTYNLYIFDINLPEENGIEVLKNLREADDKTPVIYISALTDIKTIAKAFDIGAEDYIKKPFEIEEFLIRVKAKLKTPLNTVSYKNIEIDTSQNIVKKNGKIVPLGHIQYNILKTLVENKGRIVSKDTLLSFFEQQNDNALRVTIKKIKDKLNIDIKSIRGQGYIIE